ncbi:hypothetical protein GF348_02870 [candidate division KSB3 bacterium]|nr:hypothetical protein [candidate division KSB3 bacterium]
MNDRELWPCLGTEGLEVFATTADQRYLLGEDVFLATHFPITLRRFPPDRPVETMSETELSDRLTSIAGIQRGNRLFILYGAAGSGKSELMKWLEVMIGHNDPKRSDVMIRIPRTELDVLRIAERFHHLLSESYFSWLDGEPVNRQPLHQFRKGIARWIREVYPVDALHAPGIARPHKVLRWRKVYLRVHPPIILQGIDEGEGILVTRKIGLTAFRLYDFAEVTGDERKALIALLASEERLLPFLQAAADYHWMVSQRLEKQLEMPIEELVLALYTWLAFAQGMPEKCPPGFSGGFWEGIEDARAQFPIWQGEPDEALYRSVRHLFDDFFRLRKNVYDGSRIVRRIGGRAPEALLEALMEIAPEQVDKDYRLRKEPLKDVLATVQETIEGWHQPRDEDEDLSVAAQAVVEILRKNGKRGVSLHKVPSEVFSELRDERPNLYAVLRVVTALTLGAESHDD